MSVPWCLQIFSVFEPFARLFFVLFCSLSANFLIFLLIIVLSVVLFYVCLIVLCLIVGKFSNSDCQYKQTNKPTIHTCIVVHCACLLPIFTMKIYNQKIYLNKTVYFNVGPRSPTIHRPQGIRWPQFLNCSLLDLCLSANWPAPPTIHRGLEWPQFLNCSLSVCLSVL